MKRLLTILTIITFIFAVTGCASDKEDTAKTDTKEKTTEKTSELTDQVKVKMYNSLRIAELKVNEVFAKETAADETTPVVNSAFANEEATVSFLGKYYSEEIAKEMFTYYVTDQKTADGQTIVKAEPYFSESIIDTEKEDVTTKGDANKATISTKDHTIYTVELQNEQYVITKIEK